MPVIVQIADPSKLPGEVYKPRTDRGPRVFTVPAWSPIVSQFSTARGPIDWPRLVDALWPIVAPVIHGQQERAV